MMWLLRDATITPVRPMIEALILIKSPEEIGFIRKEWGIAASFPIWPRYPAWAPDRVQDRRRYVGPSTSSPTMMGHRRHHTGHALGMGIHEAPFLDVGDTTPIQPGMVFSVEPGIYIPGLAGFHHSDTVLVTDDGIECLIYYPRALEDLMIPA